MQDALLSRGNVIAFSLWSWVALLLLAAGGAWLDGFDHLPIFLSATACASSAAAATAHVRIYVTRLCALIRLAHGLDESHVAACLRPVRD